MSIQLNLSSIVGAWENKNATTNGIVAIVLSDDNDVLHVHTFGACVPEPCDWGRITAQPYGSGVQSIEVKAFSATYSFGWTTTILTGHFSNQDLAVSSFHVFHDDSGRSPYASLERFRKMPDVAEKSLR